ncbi:unnamed protein product [Didymodactylos carnosus]|uniref:Uncharacterized protein n=1 Tax=Didymodactylos carnosus TaxID=1234261 RepID=A0A813T757_9BILA|nr:unnamed protein product [Didymodactylos carnosus]CAF0882894.1 unnamed protein product [Didymodactylos carnosus]CAF3590593.1 unnamed protein product [Didymodactylos carnosus]CAF3666381.1 unnamed protein product [Didymodactylos carnosus]
MAHYQVLSVPYKETTENINALFRAINESNYLLIKELLSGKKVSSSTVDYTDRTRPNTLIVCCKRADFKLLKLLLKYDKIDPLYEDPNKHRALFYAIQSKFELGVEELLKQNIFDPNLHDSGTSFTPLLQAINVQNSKIVEDLLKYGADANLPPLNPRHKGLTPLILAIINGTDEISQCLVNSLCNLNAFVEDGYTALHYSVLMSRHVTTKILLDTGAKANVRTLSGITPMTLAILSDDAYSVKILIEHGYAIKKAYSWNEYPFEQAIKVHSEGCAMMIASLGCELTVTAMNRSSNPLTLAAEEGLVNLMHLLINMYPRMINQHWIRKRQYPYALMRLKETQQDLHRLYTNPFKLKQLSRALITQTIGKFFPEKIVELKKYVDLKEHHLTYLRYNDVLDPVKHFRPVGKKLSTFEVNGIEFYWDQKTLRYRTSNTNGAYHQPHDQQGSKSAVVQLKRPITNRSSSRDDLSSDGGSKKSVKITTSITGKPTNNKQSNKDLNKDRSDALLLRQKVKSAHNAGRGIRSKR